MWEMEYGWRGGGERRKEGAEGGKRAAEGEFENQKACRTTLIFNKSRSTGFVAKGPGGQTEVASFGKIV